LPQRYATEVIHECNEAWKKLIAGQGDHKNVGIAMYVLAPISHSKPLASADVACFCSETTTNKNSPGAIGKEQVDSIVPADSRKAPAPIDPSIAKWFYIVSYVASPVGDTAD
jgi:inorganic pyrophosphatase